MRLQYVGFLDYKKFVQMPYGYDRNICCILNIQSLSSDDGDEDGESDSEEDEVDDEDEDEDGLDDEDDDEDGLLDSEAKEDNKFHESDEVSEVQCIVHLRQFSSKKLFRPTCLFLNISSTNS